MAKRRATTGDTGVGSENPAETRGESGADGGGVAANTTPAAGNARCMDGASYQQIHRSQLRNAPYNPRVMDDYAKLGLRESIRKTGGLIETPIWNRRTGNLVAGHQRLEQTDALAKGQNYQVTVAVIDVDETTERELNVRMNNSTIRGIYDIDGLEDLLTAGASYQEMGFDIVSLENLFLDAGRELDLSILGGVDSTGLTKMDDDAAARESADEIADTLTEADRAKQLEAEEEKIREIKQRKKDYIENMKFKVQSTLTVTVVFPTNELKAAFMEHIQQPPAQERLDGIALCRFLNLDIPDIAKAGGWEPGNADAVPGLEATVDLGGVGNPSDGSGSDQAGSQSPAESEI